MEIEEFKIVSTDSTELVGMHWFNESNPKAAICIAHGFAEHQQRYTHVAQFFTDKGFSVFTYDQRGHGKSPGKRGHFRSFSVLLDDLENFVKHTRRTFNDIPIILYGHSFGGAVVTNYIFKKNINEIKGALITSPWLRLAFEPPRVKVRLAKLVNSILPSHTEPNDLDPDLLSNDKEVCRRYAADPLVHKKISVRAFLEITRTGEHIIRQADKAKIPMLLAHGSHDKITAREATIELAGKLGDQCTLKIWEGLQHETHNEINFEEVLTFNLSWINNLL
ncbi:lysophospholipase [Fulvivirgaceae bacterium BMA10]|uniref:Lysophospholipase n=1 Tax=Splendidivirga corallicola TaxID=3051826 RepID=A0ABT8KKE4_9BACT|nr:lysophospholipase [Fulvivirgaceae bacterium BMA10]